MANPLGFLHPSLSCLASGSQCGKTSFCVRLVKHSEYVYDTKFSHIIWCYEGGEDTVPRDDLKDVSGIRYHPGLPSDFSELPQNSLIIVDDCSTTSMNSESVLKASVQGCHHNLQSIVLIYHNLFNAGKNCRSVGLNSHYYVLFRSLRSRSQYDIFFRQVSPANWRHYRTIYNTEIAPHPYSYLIVDCHPASSVEEAFRLRSHIFPDDNAGQIYCTKEQLSELDGALLSDQNPS